MFKQLSIKMKLLTTVIGAILIVALVIEIGAINSLKKESNFMISNSENLIYKAKEDEKINRKLTKKEYSEIEKYLYLLNIENGYMQDLGKHEEEYVPEF